MIARPLPTLVSFALAAGTLAAQAPAPGFSAERLRRIDRFLDSAVAEARIAGAVALVLRDGRVAYQRTVGWADREAGRRMKPDAIFRIASQTKAITSVAVMILFEEGRIGLDDPISRYIPAFAGTRVAVRSDTGLELVPAKRPITIRQLLTHTSGISYGTDSLVAPLYAAEGLGPKAGGGGWYTADKDEPICRTMDRLGRLPVVAQPGEEYVYGYNSDVLGCLVEVVSGVPLDRFIATRITGPLKMTDTYFFLPPDRRDRLTAVYGSRADRTIERAPDGPTGQGDYVDGPRQSFAGGAGLLSTARDYARFLQMLLNGGELDGVRILSPKTVALMTSNQIGTLFSPNGGLGFGLGFQTTEHAGASNLMSVGSYGWGGAYGTTYTVDPVERLVLVLMVQMLPDRSDARGRFPNLVYQALVASRGR
jgi:CubicO group peptidase (beta-lactamase class C family)